MNKQAVIRLRGRVAWLDVATGDVIEHGVVERAVLRRGVLVLDLRGPARAYCVALDRVAGSAFEGSWTCRSARGEKRGVAHCEVNAVPSGFVLDGDWSHGECCWAALLVKVKGP